MTAAYNLLNSAAALVGTYATLGAVPSSLPPWLAAVAVGGLIGATIGSRYLPDVAIKRLLAVVLLLSRGQAGRNLKLIIRRHTDDTRARGTDPVKSNLVPMIAVR